jgi:hypothetical protein
MFSFRVVIVASLTAYCVLSHYQPLSFMELKQNLWLIYSTRIDIFGNDLISEQMVPLVTPDVTFIGLVKNEGNQNVVMLDYIRLN